eukprot:g3647.t1
MEEDEELPEIIEINHEKSDIEIIGEDVNEAVDGMSVFPEGQLVDHRENHYHSFPLLLFSTVQGDVCALNALTGEELWRFSGSPLIHSHEERLLDNDDNRDEVNDLNVEDRNDEVNVRHSADQEQKAHLQHPDSNNEQYSSRDSDITSQEDGRNNDLSLAPKTHDESLPSRTKLIPGLDGGLYLHNFIETPAIKKKKTNNDSNSHISPSSSSSKSSVIGVLPFTVDELAGQSRSFTFPDFSGDVVEDEGNEMDERNANNAYQHEYHPKTSVNSLLLFGSKSTTVIVMDALTGRVFTTHKDDKTKRHLKTKTKQMDPMDFINKEEEEKEKEESSTTVAKTYLPLTLIRYDSHVRALDLYSGHLRYTLDIGEYEFLFHPDHLIEVLSSESSPSGRSSPSGSRTTGGSSTTTYPEIHCKGTHIEARNPLNGQRLWSYETTIVTSLYGVQIERRRRNRRVHWVAKRILERRLFRDHRRHTTNDPNSQHRHQDFQDEMQTRKNEGALSTVSPTILDLVGFGNTGETGTMDGTNTLVVVPTTRRSQMEEEETGGESQLEEEEGEETGGESQMEEEERIVRYPVERVISRNEMIFRLNSLTNENEQNIPRLQFHHHHLLPSPTDLQHDYFSGQNTRELMVYQGILGIGNDGRHGATAAFHNYIDNNNAGLLGSSGVTEGNIAGRSQFVAGGVMLSWRALMGILGCVILVLFAILGFLLRIRRLRTEMLKKEKAKDIERERERAEEKLKEAMREEERLAEKRREVIREAERLQEKDKLSKLEEERLKDRKELNLLRLNNAVPTTLNLSSSSSNKHGRVTLSTPPTTSLEKQRGNARHSSADRTMPGYKLLMKQTETITKPSLASASSHGSSPSSVPSTSPYLSSSSSSSSSTSSSHPSSLGKKLVLKRSQSWSAAPLGSSNSSSSGTEKHRTSSATSTNVSPLLSPLLNGDEKGDATRILNKIPSFLLEPLQALFGSERLEQFAKTQLGSLNSQSQTSVSSSSDIAGERSSSFSGDGDQNKKSERVASTENRRALIGRYENEFAHLGKLGSGGFGAVYKASHLLD